MRCWRDPNCFTNEHLIRLYNQSTWQLARYPRSGRVNPHGDRRWAHFACAPTLRRRDNGVAARTTRVHRKTWSDRGGGSWHASSTRIARAVREARARAGALRAPRGGQQGPMAMMPPTGCATRCRRSASTPRYSKVGRLGADAERGPRASRSITRRGRPAHRDHRRSTSRLRSCPSSKIARRAGERGIGALAQFVRLDQHAAKRQAGIELDTTDDPIALESTRRRSGNAWSAWFAPAPTEPVAVKKTWKMQEEVWSLLHARRHRHDRRDRGRDVANTSASHPTSCRGCSTSSSRPRRPAAA